MKLVKFISTVAASAVVFGLASHAHAEHHGNKGMNVPTIKAKALMTGLESPWDMAFLPDGTMFYTEKCKGLSVRTKGGQVHALYGMKGSSGYASKGDDLFCDGQAGMLGVVADINFAKNRTLYVYSTSNKYYGTGCKTNFERCDGNIVMKFKVRGVTSRPFPAVPISSRISSTSRSSRTSPSVAPARTTAAVCASDREDSSG